MIRSQDLANRLQEVLLDGKWIANTNFKEQILSINWEQATTKVANLNTIALLTFYLLPFRTNFTYPQNDAE
ncbi:MAG: hypothetical protein IPP34_14725 [Bacteroidetes bacterium]|nr:hypothetical protein [Bacteroidota bacterium]